MLRLIKLVVLAVICVVLVVLGVANMAPVDLHLLPEGVLETRYTVSGVPLAAVILTSMLVGVVLGELFEWVREHKHRRRASTHAREVQKLEAEIRALKKKHGEKDDLPRIAAQ